MKKAFSAFLAIALSALPLASMAPIRKRTGWRIAAWCSMKFSAFRTIFPRT